ncbi:MAG: hypothetical protein EOL92_00440 [Bacteroidia bacterium]|nr:hypothetical protein [Bacteroidia bacterium]
MVNQNVIKVILSVDDTGTSKIVKFGNSVESAAGKASRHLSTVGTAAKAMIAAISAAAIVETTRRLISMADAYTRVEGRIRLVTESSSEAAMVQEALYQVAQRSGAQYLATADVYTRFAQAVKGQNVAQSDLVTITEALNKAFTISGASTEEQASTTVQLSQAFASGVLRGDEFNSVMESGGRVIDMFTAYTGKSRGELRKMAEAGQITADVMKNALLAGADQVNSEFDRMPKTVGQAANMLVNAFERFIDWANDATGATSWLSDALKHAADYIDGFTTKLKGIAGLDVKIRSTIIAIEAEFIRLSMLVDRAGGTLSAFVARAGQAYDAVKNLPQHMTNGIMHVLDPLEKAHEPIATMQSDLTRLGEGWNKLYEERYKAGDKALQGLAELEVRLSNKAKENITVAEENVTATKPVIKAFKDLDGASRKNKKSHDDAAKSAKKHADELLRLRDRYLPLVEAANTMHEAESGLRQLRDKGVVSAEQYATALSNVRREYDDSVESATKAKQKVKELADAYEDVTIALMNDSERKIHDIQQTNAELEKQVDLLIQGGKITAQVGETWKSRLGETMADDIRQVNEELDGTTKLFEDVAKNIQSVFSGMFEDMLEGTGNFMDSILSMFRKLLAQMATMAIAGPVIIPVVGAIGGAMGVSDSSIAKTLGVEKSAVSGGFGGIGSLFQTGSLQDMGVYGLAGIGDAAYGLGLDSVGNLAKDAAIWMNGLSSGLADGLMAGVGSLAVSLLSGQGLTAKTGLQAVGSALGGAIGGVGGSLLGGIGGSLIGGLFDDDDPPEFGIDAGILKNAQSSFSAKGGGFAPTKDFYDPNFNETARSIHPIFTAYDEAIAGIQTNFNAQIKELSEALPEHVRDSFLDNLESVDFVSVLTSASSGKWLVSEGKEAIESIAGKYADGLVQAMGAAYGTALEQFLAGHGAAGLVGDDGVWNMLTADVQSNITSAFSGAVKTINGGDVEGGISTITSIQQAIDQIVQAMAPITEIIDTNGLSEYELGLRSVNQQFDQYAAALAAAGVDLSKYTDLEEARGIALKKIIDAENERIAADRESAAMEAAKAAEDAEEKAAALAADRRQLEIKIMELEGDASSALAAQREIELASMDESLRPLQERIYAIQDEAAAAEEAAAAIEDLKTSLGTRITSMAGEIQTVLSDRIATLRANLSQAYENEKQAIEETMNAKVAALEAEAEASRASTTAAQEVVSSWSSVISTLESAGTKTMTVRQALAAMDKYVSGAWSGVVPDEKGLGSALSALKGISSSSYGSRFDMERDQALAANKISALASVANAQQSVAEKQLDTLESQDDKLSNQIDIAKADAQAQLETLTIQYENAVDQLDVLEGVEKYTGTMAEVIASIDSFARINAEAQAKMDSLMHDLGVTQVDLLNQQLSVSQYSSAQLSAVANGLSSLQSLIIQAIAIAAAASSSNNDGDSEKVPGFADGGYFSGGLRLVGENGPELEATGPSRIWNAQDTSSILGGWSKETAEEVRQLRVELRAQSAAMVRTQQKMNKILERWNIAGMPETRVVAA